MRTLFTHLAIWAVFALAALGAPIGVSAVPPVLVGRSFSDRLSEMQIHTFQDVLPATVAAPSQALKTRFPSPEPAVHLHSRGKSETTSPLLANFKATATDSTSILSKLKSLFSSSASGAEPNPKSLMGRIAAVEAAFQTAWDTHAGAIPEELRGAPITFRELLTLLRRHTRMLVPLDSSIPADEATRSLYLRWLKNGLKIGGAKVL